MKKILDFFKANIIIAKWTICYFLALWFILKFLFSFDMLDLRYWDKFFHATLHGFGGFVFGTLIYSAIPIYIASVLIIYRTKAPIIQIPILEKISDYTSSFFVKKNESEKAPEPAPEPEPEKTEQEKAPEYPDDLPHELRVPFMRAKKHLSLSGNVSVYNKPKKIEIPDTPEKIMENAKNFPIPTDFDISEDFSSNNINDMSMPTFTDINFDEPVAEEKNHENKTTKYLASKNIDFETYHEFVATEKYVIYEHNDDDFWIMDNDSWFAAGKQIDNPTIELLELAKQNNLIPVLYLASQNIMDIDETIKQFESNGIRVIKNLDELN